jgi:hypothetical protein
MCLALHGGCWDVIATELIHKFLPSDSEGILSSCTVVLPPSQSSSGELVSSQTDLVVVSMLKWLEFSLDNTQPVICIQGVVGSCKGGWLGPQKSCQFVICTLLTGPWVGNDIGQNFQ